MDKSFKASQADIQRPVKLLDQRTGGFQLLYYFFSLRLGLPSYNGEFWRRHEQAFLLNIFYPQLEVRGEDGYRKEGGHPEGEAGEE